MIFEVSHLAYGYLAQQALCSKVDYCYLFFNRERRVLRLLQDFHVAGAFVDNQFGSGIEVPSEFGEGFHFAVESLVEVGGTANFLNELSRGVSTYAANGKTPVVGRPDTEVE